MRVHGLPVQFQGRSPSGPVFGQTVSQAGEADALSLHDSDSFQATTALDPPKVKKPAPRHANPVRQLIWTDGVSMPFLRKAYRLFLEKVPDAVIQNLLDEGYSIVLKERITRNRPDLHPDFNYTGGLHLEGERAILIAQNIIGRATGEPIETLYWGNALLHEIGHRVAFHLGRTRAKGILPNPADPENLARLREKNSLNLWGVTEGADFRNAYLADYDALTEEMRALDIKFAYFTTPRIKDGNPLEKARQETFAEAFDILLRGPESRFNYENFTRYLPRTLRATCRILQAHYPDFQPHPALQPLLEKEETASPENQP